MPTLSYNLILKGGRKMIGVAMYITIKSLWERHKNKSLIARLTGHDWHRMPLDEKNRSRLPQIKSPGKRNPDIFSLSVFSKSLGSLYCQRLNLLSPAV